MYRSACCESGEWHHHSKKECHRQFDEDYHLVAWDTAVSCGWATYYKRTMYEGAATSLEEAKRQAEKAVEIHQRMMLKMRSIGLTQIGD